MGLHQQETCFITGVKATPYIDDKDAIEYSINYNGNRFFFSFSGDIIWEEIPKETMSVLKALLYNNNWQIDSGVNREFIDKELLQTIVDKSIYPRTFEGKVFYLLRYISENGGNEKIKFNWDSKKDYLICYCNDSNEFMRVLEFMKEEGWITYTEAKVHVGSIHDLTLTKGGRNEAIKHPLRKGLFAVNIRRPKIYVFGVSNEKNENNQFYQNKVADYFSKNECIVTSKFKDANINSNYYTEDISSIIQNQNYDYVIYLRSYLADGDKQIREILENAESILRTSFSDYDKFYSFSMGHDTKSKLLGFISKDQQFDLRVNDEYYSLLYRLRRDWNLRERQVEKEERGHSEEEDKVLTEDDTEQDEATVEGTDGIFENQYFLYWSDIGVSLTTKIEDAIGVDKLAIEIVSLLNNLDDEDKEKMIGIFGKWGRGKTRLIENVKKHLQDNKDKKYHIVDFHAWKYQDNPATWSYLYEELSGVFFAGKGLFKEILYTIKLNWLNRGKWVLISNLLILILSSIWATLLDIENKIQIIGYVGLGNLVILVSYYLTHKNRLKQLSNSYLIKPNFRDNLGLQAEVNISIKNLIKLWIPESKIKAEKIILIVDDIDRCDESKIIQVIDSFRVVLEDEEISKRLIVVAAIDQNILERAIIWKYSKLIRDGDVKLYNTITKEYFDKLFLFSIKLGKLTFREKTEILKFISKGKIEILNSIAQKELGGTKEEKHKVEEEKNKDVSDTEDVIGIGNIEIDEEAHDLSESRNLLLERDDITENYYLTSDEFDLMKEKLKRIDITPRQIRILFYRYLFAKHLVFSRIKSRDWSESKNKHIILDMILEFQYEQNIEEKFDMVKSEIDKGDIPSIFKGTEFKQETMEELTKIVELVVAY